VAFGEIDPVTHIEFEDSYIGNFITKKEQKKN